MGKVGVPTRVGLPQYHALNTAIDHAPFAKKTGLFQNINTWVGEGAGALGQPGVLIILLHSESQRV